MSISDQSTWFHHSGRSDVTEVSLFCFPQSGGSAASFNSWRPLLPDWIELIKVQIPGRAGENDVSRYYSAEALVPDLLAQFSQPWDKPIALYGHSMGALLAFEVANFLETTAKHELLGLFVSGRRAPHIRIPEHERLYALDETALVQRLVESAGDTAQLLTHKKWADYYLPSIRADLSVSDQYVCKPNMRITAPVYAFLGDTDSLIPKKSWAPWSDIALGEYERFIYPGNHFFAKAGQKKLISTISSKLEHALAVSALSCEIRNDILHKEAL